MGDSIPGLAIHYSFKFLAGNIFFSLFLQKRSTSNTLFHLHLDDDPNTVFRRYLKVSISFLKDMMKEVLCKKAAGCDEHV